jgi:hypothetical protein
MSRRSSAVIVTVALLALSGCGGPSFKEFSSADGKFKVQMPGTPKETSQTQGDVKLKMFIVEEKNGAYAVMYADLPFPEDLPPAVQAMSLNGSVESMTKGANGKKIASSEIKLADKYPGRSVEADLPDKGGKLNGRIYLVGKRLYQVLVMGKGDFSKSEAATKFLDSFELLP